MSDPLDPLSSEGVGEESIPELVRLGELLHRAREGAGFSLEALAQRLRIEPRLLLALERGDHRQLPEGVFIVALARRIAGFLNVNMEEAITNVRQSRLMGHKPPGKSPSSKEMPSEISDRPPQASRQTNREMTGHPGRPSANPWVWPLAALLTACGAAAAWILLAQTPYRSPQKLEPVSPAAAPPHPPTAKPSQGTTSPGFSGQGPSQVPTPAMAPDTPSGDTLRLQATEPSWLEVRDASGKTVFEGTFSGVKTFPLGTGLEVMTGRPHAVRASIGAGKAAPLGGVDDIRWKRFSPQAPTPAAPPGPSPAP